MVRSGRGEPHDANFPYLVRCVRANFDPQATGRDAGIASRGVSREDRLDWGRLRSLARHNRVDVLFINGLARAGASDVPAEELEHLKKYEAENRARNARSAAELLAILRDASSAGLDCLALKGPVLGEHAYGDIGKRFFWDLDFLVRADDLPGLHRLLVSRGYVRELVLTPRQERFYQSYHFAYCYEPVAPGPDLDVHWSLLPDNFRVAIDYDDLWDRSVELSLGEATVRTLSWEDTLLYLSLHGAKEEWRRLQMVADVCAVLASMPQLDLDRCMHMAERLHARRMFLLALHLASDWLGAPVPQDLRRRALSDRALRALAADAWQRMQREAARGTSVFEVSEFRMNCLERRRDRLGYLWRTVSMPRLKHLAMIDLPLLPRGFHRVVRLTHDFGAIPLRGLVRRVTRTHGGGSGRA